MTTGRTILLAGALALSGTVSSTEAQPGAEVFVPVDQTVSDLDLRAGSLRHVEQGIGVYGQTGYLYRRQRIDPWSLGSGQPLTQQYLLRQPGFTAWIDRPDYLVRDELGELRLNVSPAQDGQFLGLIPPNTVFDLTPPTTVGLSFDSRPMSDGWFDMRINTRMDGLIDTRLSTEISGQVGGSSVWSFPPPPKGYKLLRPQPDTDDPSQRPADESADEPFE